VATILVIEEEEVIRGLVKVILENAGHRAILAGSGEAGIRLATHNAVDALVLDCMGRVSDGVGTLKRIRGDARTAHIPVIAMCGLGQSGAEVGLWANGLVVKPFRPAQLLLRVQAVLEARKQPESQLEIALPAVTQAC
jgi:two-component system OmpR family response regulator